MLLHGIHHITAIASDPQRNIDFYSKILGLRLVKVTVNFDDPSSYHLYYGNETGDPGTLITFFSWSNAMKGREGVAQPYSFSFRVPLDSFPFWLERLTQKGVSFHNPAKRFDEKYIRFKDNDGVNIELVGVKELGDIQPWTTSEINRDVAIRGFHGATIWEEFYDNTDQFLKQGLELEFITHENNIYRYAVGNGKSKHFIDVKDTQGFWDGANGTGTIHHIALEARSDSDQEEISRMISKIGIKPTEQIDRKYFKSVYFKEPGGSLFEIATSKPGFLIDETKEELGKSLKLPEQYENIRTEIEGFLPKLEID
jgi:catechol 2,3-dioxygenase-like lactoylglutathione lyase family enzyme